MIYDCNKKRICIVCEGFEELEYIEALKRKKVFSDLYEFVLINAKSISNIFPRYQDKFQSDTYSLVLVFCDTDKSPFKQYKELKRKINEYHATKVADDIVIFGNPYTMQIILSHFSDIKLSSQSKSVNAKYIEKFVGISNYSASATQRKELFDRIKRDNYKIMKANLEKLSTDDECKPSTNFLKFVQWFESDNTNWINKINEKL